MRAPLVMRDREYPFSEDFTVDETGGVDSNLGIMAKVPSLIEVFLLAEVINWYTSSGRTSLCLLSESTWM